MLLPALQPEPLATPHAGTHAGAAASDTAHRPRLYVLDGLRLIAALLVMCFHFVGKPAGWERTWRGSPDVLFPVLHPIAVYGWLGVELFFLISGFVICMSCWGKRPSDFLVSRLVRLYPAYWAAVALTTAVVLAAGYSFTHPRDLTVRNVLINLTMLQAPLGAPAVDPSYWTLWAEMLFYVLFAGVVAAGLTYRRVVLFCLIWTFVSAVAPKADMPLLDLAAGPAYSPYFVAGIAMYLMYRFGPGLVPMGLVVLSWAIALYRLPGTISSYQMWLSTHISWTVCAAAVTGCFLLVLGSALGWFGWMNRRRLRTAGALTYPLYLLHQQIGLTGIHWLRHRLAPTPTLAAAAAAVLLLAWLLHRTVERPLAAVLKRGLVSSFAAVGRADAVRVGSEGPGGTADGHTAVGPVPAPPCGRSDTAAARGCCDQDCS